MVTRRNGNNNNNDDVVRQDLMMDGHNHDLLVFLRTLYCYPILPAAWVTTEARMQDDNGRIVVQRSAYHASLLAQLLVAAGRYERFYSPADDDDEPAVMDVCIEFTSTGLHAQHGVVYTLGKKSRSKKLTDPSNRRPDFGPIPCQSDGRIAHVLRVVEFGTLFNAFRQFLRDRFMAHAGIEKVQEFQEDYTIAEQDEQSSSNNFTDDQMQAVTSKTVRGTEQELGLPVGGIANK